MILEARYANPLNTAIEIRTEDAGWQIVGPGDGALWSQAVAANPEPYRPVIPSVTPLQARRALRAAGLYEQAVAAVQASNDPDIQDAWEYATIWERTDPNLIALANALGLTDEQVDQLFLSAAAL